MNLLFTVKRLFRLSYRRYKRLVSANQMNKYFSFGLMPQKENRPVTSKVLLLNVTLVDIIYISHYETSSFMPEDPGGQAGNIFFSWWAIAAYLLIPIIIRYIIRYNTRRLTKEKQILERLVNQRTREIIRQKEEIKKQRDILKKKSFELENALNAISDQNKKLELLNATKDKFFSIVAHDLKGPLNSLSSFSDLLSKYTEALTIDEIKAVSHDLHKAVRNTFHLAENLLTWARAQMNGLNYSPKPLMINEIILQNLELLETAAHNKNIKIETDLTDDLVAYADEDHIKFVIRNFLTNAIKFTPPRNGVIHVSSYYDIDNVVVEVRDNGIGMNENQIKNIFNIDCKCTTDGTAGEKGTGLGLLLCKEFINQNGGSIYVQSTYGKGSVFGIRLFASKPELEPARNKHLN